MEVSHSLVTPWDAANLRKEDGFRILPAKNVLACLGIAIGGHAFWNGTLVSIEKLGEVLGLGLGGVFILNMAWVSVLIIVLLILARGIFKGVRTLPAT